MTQDEIIGQYLATLCRDRGISQGKLARLLHWHRPTVSELMAGRRSLKVTELIAIAAFLPIASIDFLRGILVELTMVPLTEASAPQPLVASEEAVADIHPGS